MILEETYLFSNGIRTPKLGFGTWQIPDRDAAEAVLCALRTGYRHIDTAAAYGNERGVGEGVRGSGLRREEVFVTTKIPAETKTADGAKRSIEESLRLLDLEYIDLLLIHAPKPWELLHDPAAPDFFEENRTVWRVMEEAQRAGLVRSLGVSNFTPRDLENILSFAGIPPVDNQIAVFIDHPQTETVEYCQARDILVTAHSPNAHGALRDNPLAVRMAEKYGVSVPQLSVRWCLERGLQPLPKSVNPAHIAENAAVDFALSPEDLAVLTAE